MINPNPKIIERMPFNRSSGITILDSAINSCASLESQLCESFTMNDILFNSDISTAKTNSRNVFNTYHRNGQVKLLLVELFFITHYIDFSVATKVNPIIILYIGCSPGIHFDALLKLCSPFDNLIFHLYDSVEPDFEWDERCMFYKEIFGTEEHIYRYRNTKNVYIISDAYSTITNEYETMRESLRWCSAIKPEHAMLRFIPLYESRDTQSFKFCKGTLIRQPYLPNPASELRIITNSYECDTEWFYDELIKRIQYHNDCIRKEYIYKNPFTNFHHAIYGKKHIGCNWDSSAFVFIVNEYIKCLGLKPTYRTCIKIIEIIFSGRIVC